MRLAGLAALIGLVVAWLCFRTVRLTAIVFVISAYSAALSLAVVPLVFYFSYGFWNSNVRKGFEEDVPLDDSATGQPPA